MFLALVAAAIAVPAPCVKAGETPGVARAWFRNNESIAVEKKTYVKYGLPRTGVLQYLEPIPDHDGVPVMVEKGVREHEVLYVLADAAECSFQPYQIKPK